MEALILTLLYTAAFCLGWAAGWALEKMTWHYWKGRV